MKIQTKTLARMFASLLCLGTSLAQDAIKPECTTVVEHLTAEVTKDPSRLLLAVEDALTLNDKCACEIVSTAIKISKADSEMVGRIVTTSVQAAPTAASSIAECALAAAPDSASAIKQAMKSALGQGDTEASSDGKEVTASGKDVVSSGKEVVGKEPVGKLPIAPLSDEETDPIGAPLNTAGVYLYTPAGGGGATVIEKETIVIIKKEEKIIRRVVRESTHSRCICVR